MTRPIRPLPSPLPPPLPVEVYLPRLAFDRITELDIKASAQRLNYDGPLHWATSVNDLPHDIAPGSIRLRCTVIEALVFLECVRALLDVASAREEDELIMSCADALTALFDGVDYALNHHG